MIPWSKLPLVFKVMNQLQSEGLISKWALAGGIATIFYTDIQDTKDADFFVYYAAHTPTGVINPHFVLDRLSQLGHKVEGWYAIIHGIRCDLIEPKPGLDEEALAHAVEHQIQGVQFHILTPEYLMAIAARVGRLQDKAKIQRILAAKVPLDRALLNDILHQYHLVTKFKEIARET